MPVILNIETASTNCSVALAKDGQIIAFKEDNSKQFSHAERLHIYIQDVLKEANVETTDLDAVAVSKGPGSYTGLRIGVSSAKGLCFALGIPLISVETLTALAHQAQPESGVVVSMLDARRLEVYSAIFASNYSQIRATEAQILDENAFSEYLEKGKVYFVGSGVEKTKDLITHSNAIFVEGKLPSAVQMALLSFEKYKISDTEDVAYFEPYYLKDFVAGKPKKMV